MKLITPPIASVPYRAEAPSRRTSIRAIAVNAPQLQSAATLPLTEIPFHARLDANQQASLGASIRLHPQTPPGNYDFELTVGSRTLQATAHVAEVVDLRLQPADVTILAGDPGPHIRSMVAENAGNTTLVLGTQCEAPVFDSFDLISSMLIGLHKGDKGSAGALAKAFLTQWAELVAGTLVIKRKAVTLKPGEKVVADVEFHLPAELKPLRHYRAGVELYNAPVSLDIYTSAKYGPDTDSKPAAERQGGSPK